MPKLTPDRFAFLAYVVTAIILTVAVRRKPAAAPPPRACGRAQPFDEVAA